MDNSTLSFDYESCMTDSIFEHYKDTISDIIAYIEVYEHDLPEDVMAETAELFQMIAFYETESQKMPIVEINNALSNISAKVTQLLYVHAICLFINKIQEYKKAFKMFKYKGVMLEGKNFIQLAKCEEKKIVRDFSDKLKLFYKGKIRWTLKQSTFKQKIKYLLGYFKVSKIPSLKVFKHEPYIPKHLLEIDDTKEQSLKLVYNETKDLLEKYEEIFPTVICNGANKPLWMSIFLTITGWIIPFALLVPMLMRLFCGK